MVFEVFIFQQSEVTESYQNSELLGTLLALFLWESLINVACLNKWGLILHLFWRSDEKPFLNIIKIYQTTHSIQYISTCQQAVAILKGHFLHPSWLSELTWPAACQVKFMEWILTGIAGILCCAFLKS